MEMRVAVIGIIIEKKEVVEELNGILHENRDYIIGRMGIPYDKRGINIISIAIDAPQDVINTLSGRLGQLEGVKIKTAYSDVVTKI